MEFLTSVTLGTSSNTWNITNIPTGYDSLFIYMRLKSGNQYRTFLKFNNQADGYQAIGGRLQGLSRLGINDNNVSSIDVNSSNRSNTTLGDWGVGILKIHNANHTSGDEIYFEYKGNSHSDVVGEQQLLYYYGAQHNLNSAITSLNFEGLNQENIDAGSRVDIYGIGAV